MKAADATHEIIEEAMKQNKGNQTNCYENLTKMVKDYREKIQHLADVNKRVVVFEHDEFSNIKLFVKVLPAVAAAVYYGAREDSGSGSNELKELFSALQKAFIEAADIEEENKN